MIPVSVQKIAKSKSYTAFYVGTQESAFPIYCAPHIGQTLLEEDYPRPLTHTFLDRLFDALDITVLKLVIHDARDPSGDDSPSVYYARLFVEQVTGDGRKIVELDARPSDCLPYAITHNVPIFCAEKLFNT